ncbi:TetR/AcrR family transcriptional regulator [Streptomyces adustus]|uniref:TetR/AcrR family transcriptional regulator n=1 Tax=Streptomyces adustus TaxID=1609272 RepID=UPI0037244476
MRRTATKSGVVLSRELIVGAAMGLIAEHGSDALTVRRLGAALGASPTAVYRYFTDMDDLVLEIADRLIGISLDGYSRSGDWKADLRDLAVRAHRAYQEHPRAAMLVASRTTGRANEARIIEEVLASMEAAGLTGIDAVRAYRAYGDMVLAMCGVYAAFAALPEEVREADRQRWSVNHAAADPQLYPRLKRLAPKLVTASGETAYTTAVDLFINGLELRARAAR